MFWDFDLEKESELYRLPCRKGPSFEKLCHIVDLVRLHSHQQAATSVRASDPRLQEERCSISGT